MKYSSILSDEEGVKAWLRDYSGELLSVGIELGLTADQQTALQNHLVSVRQGFDAMTTIKTNFQSDLASHRSETDPINLRRLNEHKYQQSEQRDAA